MSTALKHHTLPSNCRSCNEPTEALILAAGPRPGERVVVIGPGSLGHLLGLARIDCAGAAAFRSVSACRREPERADVVWLTGIEAIDADLAKTIDHLDTPRIVAIELTHDGLKAGMAGILAELRVKGLADQAVIAAGGRTLVVASRPTWLRRVI